jgi:hypothetical protein
MTLAPRESPTHWTLYVDESGNFADVDDDVTVSGLLIRDDVPGLSVNEVKRALENVVPGFPWPWHARLINNAAWVALVLADRGLPPDHPNPDIRWLSDAVRRVNDRFAERFGSRYAAIRARLSSEESGDIRLEDLSDFERILRNEYPSELDALRAHIRRARTAVKQFAAGLATRAGSPVDSAAAVLVFSSETLRGDARTEPESALGDRRYFRLLEVLVDRTAALLARRGGMHELSLDISQRRLIEPQLLRPTKQLPLHVLRELSQLIAKWRPVVRIVASAVTPFDRHIGMRFVVADFAANRGRRALRQGSTPLTIVESEVEVDMGLRVRSGNPGRSHLAASGEAYDLCQSPRPEPQAALPTVWPRRRWACEQAWEWCRSQAHDAP